MKLAAKKIREGTVVPWGWGIAWYEPVLRQLILYPLPLNWVAYWARMIYYALARGPKEQYYQAIRQELEEEYLGGFSQGYKDGEKNAWDAVKRKVDILKETGFTTVDIEMPSFEDRS